MSPKKGETNVIEPKVKDCSCFLKWWFDSTFLHFLILYHFGVSPIANDFHIEFEYRNSNRGPGKDYIFGLGLLSSWRIHFTRIPGCITINLQPCDVRYVI